MRELGPVMESNQAAAIYATSSHAVTLRVPVNERQEGVSHR